MERLPDIWVLDEHGMRWRQWSSWEHGDTAEERIAYVKEMTSLRFNAPYKEFCVLYD
jgi:hypothetical protein